MVLVGDEQELLNDRPSVSLWSSRCSEREQWLNVTGKQQQARTQAPAALEARVQLQGPRHQQQRQRQLQVAVGWWFRRGSGMSPAGSHISCWRRS